MGRTDHHMLRASESDLDEILDLLTETGLPHEGVEEHLAGFVVARDAHGRLAGAAGVERHGSTGLLRSVAVSPALQRSGLGSTLTALALAEARSAGLEEVVLLTTTARDFFCDRFGFREAERTDFDAKLAASPEWSLPRCSSAACLRLGLVDAGPRVASAPEEV